MKRLALAIGAVGAAQATLWVWGPPLLRWQARNALERYNAIESLAVVLREQEAAMRFVFVEAGVLGCLTLLASVLLLKRRRLGWNLWLACLGLGMAGSVITVALSGASPGSVVRVVLLLVFASATFQAYRAGCLQEWFPPRT